MNNSLEKPSKLGVMLVGIGGAVATTAIAGIKLLQLGKIGIEGLPLSSLSENLTISLVDYENLVFSGWDLAKEDLANAAAHHDILTLPQFEAVSSFLKLIHPLPAVMKKEFCVNVGGDNIIGVQSHRAAIEVLRQNIREFRAESNCESIVVINLASTEKFVDKNLPIYTSLIDFEDALNNDSSVISPAMLYAYAAISENVPYGNFTPSVAVDISAMVEFAKQQNVPITGKDGKTGQTMIKTVIAPALRTRALKVEGWFSTNLLGNLDGLVLSNPESLKSKVTTKSSVLEDILGYSVDDHIVDIRYYRPRGDNKEAWDNIDIQGFLGQKMQIKINFLCKDSILAAPLVIEIARLLDLAKRNGARGVQEQFSIFFKLPQVEGEFARKPIHAFHEQEKMLLEWLVEMQK